MSLVSLLVYSRNTPVVTSHVCAAAAEDDVLLLTDCCAPLSALPRESITLPTHNNITRTQLIMDGNSRWATRQGLPALVGHERGVAALKSAVVAAREWGIPALTVSSAVVHAYMLAL